MTHAKVRTLAHSHNFFISGEIDNAPIDPTDPIPHTTFRMLTCDCGAVTVFPFENYELTTPAFKLWFNQWIKADGNRLIDTRPGAQVPTPRPS